MQTSFSYVIVILNIKIAASIDDVAVRLKKIEGHVGGGNSVSFGGSSFRRKSSYGRGGARSRIQSSANLSPLHSASGSAMTPEGGSARGSLEGRLLDTAEEDQMEEMPSSDVRL